MNEYNYFVYILTNKHNTVLYTGVTNNIERRIYEHQQKLIPGFTQQYRISKLIYFEHYEQIEEAITREKQIKSWRREKKEELINKENPAWDDLSDGWF